MTPGLGNQALVSLDVATGSRWFLCHEEAVFGPHPSNPGDFCIGGRQRHLGRVETVTDPRGGLSERVWEPGGAEGQPHAGPHSISGPQRSRVPGRPQRPPRRHMGLWNPTPPTRIRRVPRLAYRTVQRPILITRAQLRPSQSTTGESDSDRNPAPPPLGTVARRRVR